MTKFIPIDPSESSEQNPLMRPPPQALIRKELAGAGVLAVRLIGPPGSGKTELIETTIKRLKGRCRVAVIVVNPAAQRDAGRLRPHCAHVESIDASVPRAAYIWNALQNIPRKDVDLLLIEACGGLTNLEDLGQDATVATFGVSGGDDKAAEYHTLVENSSVVLLTQQDMRPLVKFNEHEFRHDVQSANPEAKVFELSTVSGSGLSHWLEWLGTARLAKKRRNANGEAEPFTTDKYFG
jgi:hydrogenase nickel incorporation protein HypB